MTEQLGYNYTKPRGPIGAMMKSPGPIYMLPPLIGEKDHDIESTHPKAPAYSLGKIINDRLVERSPGPAAYLQNPKLTNIGDTSGPKYTMTPRSEFEVKDVGPGPAQYDANKAIKYVLPRLPEPIIGMRLDHTVKNANPAPNAYSVTPCDIKSTVGSAPKYTIAGRGGEMFMALNKNPGPSDYAVGNPDLVMQSAPKYSMGCTLKPPNKSQTPGPDLYKHETVKVQFPSSPKFTMGIKHSEYIGELDIRNEDNCY